MGDPRIWFRCIRGWVAVVRPALSAGLGLELEVVGTAKVVVVVAIVGTARWVRLVPPGVVGVRRCIPASEAGDWLAVAEVELEPQTVGSKSVYH